MEPVIEVENLTLKYGDRLIQQDLNFTINRGDIFIIMGGSGCGKSTLLKHLIGLLNPFSGKIMYGNTDIVQADQDAREQVFKKNGVLFQSSGLLSSLTLGENVALPLMENTPLSRNKISELVTYKLALVGLAGYEDFYPSELSGGMQKRAGLARAMALDPDILFFDEPSAGLDPLTSKHLDELIIQLKESLAATIVVVTHELPSIFAIGTNAIFLDAETKTLIAQGKPTELRDRSSDSRVRDFLNRGGLN